MFKKIKNIILIIGSIYLILNFNLRKEVYNIKKLKFDSYGKNQVTYKSKPISGYIEEKLMCSIQESAFQFKALYHDGFLTGKLNVSSQQTGKNVVIYKNIDFNIKETKNNITVGNVKIKTVTRIEEIEESEFLILEETLDINGAYNISLIGITKFLFTNPKNKLEIDIKEEFMSKILSSNITRTVIARNEIDEKLSGIIKEKSYKEQYVFENNDIIGKYYKHNLDGVLIETANYNDKGQLQGWRTLFDDNGVIYESSYYTYGYLVIKQEYENGKITTKEEFINGELNKITTFDYTGDVKEVMFKKGNSWRIYED